VARFIEVNLHLMLDAPVGYEQQWPPLAERWPTVLNRWAWLSMSLPLVRWKSGTKDPSESGWLLQAILHGKVHQLRVVNSRLRSNFVST
jgi:hypothetical protein